MPERYVLWCGIRAKNHRLTQATCFTRATCFSRATYFFYATRFRVLDISHFDALFVPKMRCLRGHLLIEGHILFEGQIMIFFSFVRLIEFERDLYSPMCDNELDAVVSDVIYSTIRIQVI